MDTGTIAGTYGKRQQQYAEELKVVSRKHYQLGMARLAAALVALTGFFLYVSQDELTYLVPAIAASAVFVRLVRAQRLTERRKLMAAALEQINSEEIAYLATGALQFADGAAYKDPLHAYADDLDLFGSRSLYQHLNRTGTQMGRNALAASLLGRLDAGTIKQRQEAVAEMAPLVDDRQKLYATARIGADSNDAYQRLLRWAAVTEAPINPALRIFAFVSPALLGIAIVIYALTQHDVAMQAIKYIVPLNLMVFFGIAKRVKQAMAGAAPVRKTLEAYAELVQLLEQGNFTSAYMTGQQQRLQEAGGKASAHLASLARIYAGMENISNPFAAFGMNGLYLYHIHVLHSLIQWKQAHAAHLRQWLDAVGDAEAVYSLANLKCNNPGFCYPELNTGGNISFTALGHPVIAEYKRVCNDVSFAQQRFVVLTGSNMSGKSTFLRTLGVNMVLACAGSAVCAAAADIQPMDIFVSMRQSDSLADNESYFFAEVKRLQHIIASLQAAPCFVLLDEILRGTNSDDKRSGTIGVIEKIIRTRAIGAIATHDLEVCLTTALHPAILVNKCFEVETQNDELVFDYILRDGVCRNKSATFMMKKMKIID